MKTITMCDRISYHYDQTVGEPVPPMDELVELLDHSDGNGIQFDWLTSFAPTKAVLLAYDEATVGTWVKNNEDNADADFGTWTKKEKALIKFFVKEINKLRIFDGDTKLERADVIAGLKAEMQ